MPVKVAAQLHEPQSGEENAPSLVILHGLFGSAGNWRSLSRQLASEHAVHALDLRNHGVSPHHDLMTYAEMAGDIVQYLDENVGDAPILMGHSMGGKAAMRLALSHGGGLSKLVVVDIAPVPNQHDFDHLLQAMSLIDTKTIRGRGEADKALAERVVDPPLPQFLLQNLVRDDTGYRWRINLEAIRANMDAILDFPIPDDWQAFEQPTLFISRRAIRLRSQRAPQNQSRAFSQCKNSDHRRYGSLAARRTATTLSRCSAELPRKLTDARSGKSVGNPHSHVVDDDQCRRGLSVSTQRAIRNW